MQKNKKEKFLATIYTDIEKIPTIFILDPIFAFFSSEQEKITLETTRAIFRLSLIVFLSKKQYYFFSVFYFFFAPNFNG